ncbi:MAG: rRNA maturation RNase YbeY [Candidatus Liptonbacteria bacterium RIFCSPLOWO2_01_FULL_53_13]|uniref:rRNA maturation RNase YbeY n=1 Tax=Candidatus Liptonbacteria bacterium RIFCSPLOWO2_01_FULL_53_13 TaxID=1798651 RepID=A0A1G2CK96_9BACT|nr:MAG: rRNA maturation RNase YbeY [Candidatus Liptonbacteria bacterium RIFCSPLOWO2_01_FULL_53_13]
MATKDQKIEEKLVRVSRAVFRILRKRGAVCVALVPNSDLRWLKKKFLHKTAKIVDVLAFPDTAGFPHPESGAPPLGEVLVNKDIARKDAPRATALLIHGILHLLGYRHEKKRDIIAMEKLEKKVLKKVKISNY